MAGPVPEDLGAWQLDRKIPVALIITLLVQTAGFAFWVGQLSVRIDQLELQSQRYLTNGDRLTRLEVRIENLIETVNRGRQNNGNNN
mgnify:CR=1 FL=1